MAKSTTPGLTLITYTRICIWVALLVISGGMAMQSLQLNMLTQSDVDSRYAQAVAAQTKQALATRLEDTRRTQLAASAHPNTLAALSDPSDWSQSLQTLLPGATAVEILPLDKAGGLENRYNFAVQDLVNRTLRGDDMKLEAVRINQQLQFFWASPVPAQGQPQGVLLVRYGSDWLDAFKRAIDTGLGQTKVIQKLNAQERSGIDVLTAGQVPDRAIQAVNLPINDYWFLTYTPSDERPVLSLMSLSFPWLLTLGITLLSLFIVLFIQKKALRKHRGHFQQFLKRYVQGDISERPDFKLRLFNELADDVIDVSQHLMHHGTPSPTAGQKTATDSTDQRTEEHAAPAVKKAMPRNDLPEITEEQPPEHDDIAIDMVDDKPLPAHIFRAYDIRGLVETELKDDTVIAIGKAFGSLVKRRGFERANLAWDGRLSSEHLADCLQQGMLAVGCSVNRLGMLPTGALYYATHELDSSCGVMVTGSHNPAEYNGFKMVIDTLPLSEADIQGLATSIEQEDYSTGYAGVREQAIHDDYLQRITDDIQVSRDLKIVIDAGNGVAGPTAMALFQELGIETLGLYCEVDGNFPNHHPDPGVEANLSALKDTVIAEQADLGLAFDGDGDRVMLIDNEGNTIWPDRMMMLLIEDILPRRPGADVLFDVKSSRHLAPLINRLGGRPTMWKTGHSLMKRKLKDTKAALGGEFSGHFYIAERWYGFDDGLYTGARLIEILSARNSSVAEVFRALPEDVSTPEITLDSTEARKFDIIRALSSDEELTRDGRVFNADGLRLEYSDGWGLIRASNTTPRLTLRFAGESAETIARIQDKVKQSLTRHAPEIQTPF